MLPRIGIVLVLLQLSAAGVGAEDRGVELVEQTTWVKSLEALRQACGRIDPIRACTQVSAELIAGPCTAESGDWRLGSPLIRIVTVRILVGPSREPFNEGTVQHEAGHVADFREALAAYLEGLRNRSFESEEKCRTAGEAEKAGFNARIKRVTAASNRKRHANRTAAGKTR